ncbi:glycosyltransferase [Tenacibaculum sp.]|nr:glycosyltransferase [Tenacibaculum sp.]
MTNTKFNSSYPLVSIVIPAYNAGKNIEDTLTSIYNQDYPNIEVIVVDDGSEDNTADIAKKFDIIYIYQKNQGKPTAMNTGFSSAKGDFIASIDSDDLWHPEKISKQIQAFNANPQLEIAFCHVKQFLCPKIEAAEHKFFIPENSEILSGHTTIAMLIKKNAFYRIGAFDETYKFGDFIQWYGRAKDLGITETVLDDVLVFRRIHKSNLGSDQMAAKLSYMKVIKERLKRQKESKN